MMCGLCGHIHHKRYPTSCLHGADSQPSLDIPFVSCTLESALLTEIKHYKCLIRIKYTHGKDWMSVSLNGFWKHTIQGIKNTENLMWVILFKIRPILSIFPLKCTK